MVVCASCGQESPEDFAFCGHCGAALSVPSSHREERKVVSVLFCDLVGFTARSETADPEDVRATLAPYHQAVKAEIERFGGVVEKFVGDAVMAVFGAPRSHEDDAERAVRSALAATQAIDRLNDAHPGLDLAVRAAVNTGEAMVVLDAHPERGEAMVAGDVVNTASRLQQVGPVGAVAVGELTHRSTRGAIDYEELPPAHLKGKAAPVRLWRALHAYAADYGAAIRPATPLVGRTEELETLARAWERVRTHRVPQLVTVVGEPGVGKTRLLREFRATLGVDATWLQGRSLPYGDGITFWALGEIVKAVCGILESDPPDEVRAKLHASVEASVPDGPDRPWITGRLEPLLGLSADDREPARREDAFAAWTAYLRALARDRPVVIALEDLHWADQAMLGFAAYLVEWAQGVPILVLATARPELYDQFPTWGGGKHDAVTIALGPLEQPETAELLQALLQGAELPGEISSELLERVGGNPLYAEEFVASLLERKILVRRDGAWALAPGKTVPIPETLQALVAARIDTLEPEAKAVLEDAAVLGKVFWPSAVAAIGGRDESEVGSLLHTLSTNEFIRPVDVSSVWGQDEFSFWHLALREVAYAELPRAERIRKHTAAAAWIEQMAGDRVAEHAELLAHHATQALELARATGDDRAGELAEPAGRYLALAGERTIDLDPERALGMLERALELLPAEHPDRGRTLVWAMRAAELTGTAEAVSFGEQAVAGFESRGDVAGQVESLVDLSRVVSERGDTARSRQLLLEAVRLAETLPPGSEQAHAFTALALDLAFHGRELEALPWADRAVALAEDSGHLLSRCWAYGARGACLLGLGRAEAAVADMRQAVRLARDLGTTEWVVVGYDYLGGALSEIEGPAAALATYEEGIEFDRRRAGITFRTRWALAETTMWLFQLGRWDEVLQVAEATDAYEQAHVETDIGLQAPPQVIAVLTYRGEASRASELVDALLPRVRDRDLQVVVPMLTEAVSVRSALGDAEAVRALAGKVEVLTRERPLYRGWCAPDVARALVTQGDIEQARTLLFEPIGLTRTEDASLTVRAVLAEAEGGYERAAELYAEVASRWQAFGNVVEHAHASLGRGRCLVRLDRMPEAGPVLEVAETIFERLGAIALAEGCRAVRYVAMPPT